MGTYPPRECGIATFNQDLFNSSQKFLAESTDCKVVAMNLTSLDAYAYPPEVEWTIDQDDKEEYLALARKFNNDPQISGIILQHEYGIFGGIDGKNILYFIENCNKPIIVTLHTVLPSPSAGMKSITKRIIKKCSTVVVLTESSKIILESVYPESINKTHVIPHGIHDTEFSTTLTAKKELKMEESTILTTFGLLSRGKGIEYVIKALPKIIKKHPNIQYLILGETHPVVRRREGESYRIKLAKLVTKLNLDDHVKFYDQYLSLPDLIEFLKATDIYISTSINPFQAVSGTLSYALGTGRAVVSTEFAQAKEIITKEIGRLVPPKDSDAYSRVLLELLDNKIKLKKMHSKAYELTRPMLWSNVADNYSKLLTQNILPPVKLEHLNNMTDNFGIFQFAKIDMPNKKFGYTLDDNSRALIACCWLNPGNKEVGLLADIYLGFIGKCQLENGTFINYLNYDHKASVDQNDQEDITDATSRAIWALSEVISSKHSSDESKKTAKKMFILALPNIKITHHIRSTALIIKSFSKAMKFFPEYRIEFKKRIKENADLLVEMLEVNSDKSWHWFDSYLGYNNGIVPEALIIAGKTTGKEKYIQKGELALAFLIEKTFSSTGYMPIGHSEWYKKNGVRSYFDQQPEDPASMIMALMSAYEITGKEKYKNLIAICFSWYLGNNSLGLPLYSFKNGGCYDGLHPDRVNLNQGAESLISYLLSRLTMDRLTV